MTRYIDAELRIQDIQEEYCKPCKKRGDDYNGVVCRACWVGDCICIIDDCEEADVQPIVHAKWIDNAHGSDFFGCSNCGFIYSYWDYDKYEYCPHCGAKMDEK